MITNYIMCATTIKAYYDIHKGVSVQTSPVQTSDLMVQLYWWKMTCANLSVIYPCIALCSALESLSSYKQETQVSYLSQSWLNSMALTIVLVHNKRLWTGTSKVRPSGTVARKAKWTGRIGGNMGEPSLHREGTVTTWMRSLSNIV